MYARANKRYKKRTTRTKATGATRTRRLARRGNGLGNTTRRPRGAGPRFLGSTKPSVQRGYLPFNHSYLARLPFVEDMALSVSAAQATAAEASVTTSFRTNSVFDPDIGSNSAQPYQFDQIAPFFQTYIVYGCKVDLTFYNPISDGIIVGCRVRHANQTATAGMTLDQLTVMPNTVMQPLMNTGSQKWSTSFYVNNAQVLGVTKAKYAAENNFAASIVGNPSYAAPLLEPFAINTIDGVSNAVRVSVRMIYYVKFYEPLIVAAS